jgi:hypothetical protein
LASFVCQRFACIIILSLSLSLSPSPFSCVHRTVKETQVEVVSG